MGDSADAAELAGLRARAYGPAATGLTAAEQTRLEQLESAARPARPTSQPSAPVAEAEPPPAAPVARSAAATATVVDAPEAAPEVIRLRPSRGYLVALVTAATLVPVAAIGGFLAGGWFSGLGDTGAQPTMLGHADPEEVDASLERARGGQNWDDAAPRLLGGTGDALVWWGTVDDGKQTCVVLDVTSVGPMPLCGPTEMVRESGLGGQITIVGVPDVEAVETDGGTETIEGTPIEITYAVNPYTGSFAVTTQTMRPAD